MGACWGRPPGRRGWRAFPRLRLAQYALIYGIKGVVMDQVLVEIRAAGIPALAAVTHYAYQEPFRGSPNRCAADGDYYGCEEIEWALLDRRGRSAPWLDRKLSPRDRAEITRHLLALAAAWRAGGDL
jgi:hypothetical protein